MIDHVTTRPHHRHDVRGRRRAVLVLLVVPLFSIVGAQGCDDPFRTTAGEGAPDAAVAVAVAADAARPVDAGTETSEPTVSAAAPSRPTIQDAGTADRACSACPSRGFSCVVEKCMPTGPWQLIAYQASIANIAWDPAYGRPEPRLCAYMKGVQTCTAAPADTLTPVWNARMTIASPNDLMTYLETDLVDMDALDTSNVICSRGPITWITAADFGHGSFGITCNDTDGNPLAVIEMRLMPADL